MTASTGQGIGSETDCALRSLRNVQFDTLGLEVLFGCRAA